jgi:hypothetical protein
MQKTAQWTVNRHRLADVLWRLQSFDGPHSLVDRGFQLDGLLHRLAQVAPQLASRAT